MKDPLRHSYYVPTHKGMKAVVGWDGEVGTYWFAIVKVWIDQDMRPSIIEPDDVFYSGGDDLDRISSVADLVFRTWGEIYWWEADPKLLPVLRNDPIIDYIRKAVANDEPMQAEITDYILDTLSAFETDPTEPPTSPQATEHRGGFFKRRQ